MGLTRRGFLDAGAKGVLAAATAPLWLDTSLARALQRGERPPLLAVVFLRGAADGLHVVPPIGDRLYASTRKTLALRETLPFVKGFGLHPEMAPLRPLIERNRLAVVHACGSPEINRSHFEAQDRVEAGEVGRRNTNSGWLARGLSDAGEPSPFASLALTSQLPLSMHGAGGFAIDEPEDFGLPGASRRAREALHRDYASDPDPVFSRSGARALEALDEYEQRMGRPQGTGPRSQQGKRRRRGGKLAHQVDNLLRIEASGLPVRAVFLETSSWDTHQNQGTEKGSMANALHDLATAIEKLSEGLQERREWLLMVHTEFGRTVAPNGSRGSDHGHGSVALVAGTRVRGGLYGDWPGLRQADLSEGRDLAVTTDYRSVAWEVLRGHLGQAPPRETFPGFEASPLGLLG